MIRLSSLWAVFALSVPIVSAQTPELRALFPRQAEISAPGGRLARLALPPEVIAQCRADLSDLRILDREGREVPYFIDGGTPPAIAREVSRTVVPEILQASREEVAREGAPNLRRESYVLAAPDDPPAGGNWDLVIDSRASAFVRRAVATDGAGTPLAEGSFFRLSQPRRDRLRLALPAFSGPLTVTLEGDEPFYLEPAFRYESSRTLQATERADFELTEVSRVAERGRTTVVLARPRGLAPDVLRLVTSTPAFYRQIEIWDEGPGAASTVLGQAALFRVPALTPVEDLDVAMGYPRGDRLRLVIADGDSPPLENLAFRALVRRPALVFSLSGEGEVSALLVFGGGRAWRPRYDLTGLVPDAVTLRGREAQRAERIYDPALLAEAKLAPAVANPRFDPAPILAFAQHPGGDLDARRHRWRRRLDVEPSSEGLARLKLTVEDLAKAQAGLADLRIVDDQNRQWAYLLERREEEVRPLRPVLLAVKDGQSRYRLPLPASPATLSLLTLDSDTLFFDRSFELLGRNGERETTLARGRLTRRVGDPRPVEIACRPEGVEELELVVHDGDDAPLSWSSAEARFPVPELYFAAPTGSYSLLLGDPEATAPRYELERIRELILAVPSAPVAASPIEENPAYSAGARLVGEEGLQKILLWVALAAAVLILSGLTLRLARKGDGK